MPAPGTSNTPESGSPMPSSIVEPYLKIQAALYNDSVDERQGERRQPCDGRHAARDRPPSRSTRRPCSSRRRPSCPTRVRSSPALSEAIITYMDGLQLTPPEGVQHRVLRDDPEAVAAGRGQHRESL